MESSYIRTVGVLLARQVEEYDRFPADCSDALKQLDGLRPNVSLCGQDFVARWFESLTFEFLRPEITMTRPRAESYEKFRNVYVCMVRSRHLSNHGFTSLWIESIRAFDASVGVLGMPAWCLDARRAPQEGIPWRTRKFRYRTG